MFKADRVDFFSGARVRIGNCHTIKEALDLIAEFAIYDFCYDFRINGRSLLEWCEQGLVA